MKKYESPELQLKVILSADVISVSGGEPAPEKPTTGENEVPIMPN